MHFLLEKESKAKTTETVFLHFYGAQAQSTYMLRVPQCMSSRWNWDSPTPSLASECAPTPGTKGGGAHSPAGEGLGETQFRRLEKKLSTLPTL
jgi:hypothetical protein